MSPKTTKAPIKGLLTGCFTSGARGAYARAARTKRANHTICTIGVQSPLPRLPAYPTAQLPTAAGLEAFYRGIGSETERHPVVIAGCDPNKAMAGRRLHTGTQAETPNASALGCSRLPLHREHR